MDYKRREEVQESVEVAKLYNPHSNRVYLARERKNNLFIASTTDFFVFFVPGTILLLLILNGLFRCLFNYSVSRYLRPYTFKLVIFELLVQGNI